MHLKSVSQFDVHTETCPEIPKGCMSSPIVSNLECCLLLGIPVLVCFQGPQATLTFNYFTCIQLYFRQVTQHQPKTPF